MSGRRVILAVEDKLSEAVSTKILEGLGIDISQLLGLKGKGYLQSKAPSLNQTARIPHPVSCNQTHFFCWYFDLNEAIPIGGFQSPSCSQQPKACVGERYA
jgi:hypothetical protein